MNNTTQEVGRTPITLRDIRDMGTVPLCPHAADVLGIGRSSAYMQAEAGTIPTLRLGRRLVVPVPALRRMLGDDAA